MADDVMRRFGAAARTYDATARIQQLAAREVACRCPAEAMSILDAGCGTGVLTHILADQYPSASITGLDFSAEMLREASAHKWERVTFIQADLRRPPLDVGQPFDLIVSNAAFQWVPDLSALIVRLNALLTSNGKLVFSYFGPKTYNELAGAISRIAGIEVRLPCASFAAPESLGCALSATFDAVDIETKVYREKFTDLRALISDIKASGTRGPGSTPPVAWTPGFLRRLEEDYIRRHDGIVASYQVTYCTARRAA